MLALFKPLDKLSRQHGNFTRGLQMSIKLVLQASHVLRTRLNNCELQQSSLGFVLQRGKGEL